MTDRPALPRWITWLIVSGAATFTLALIVSAVFDPSIRVLHTLQALIYVAVVVLARRNNPWGFGAGALMAAFWNYINLFVTNFIPNGVGQVALLFQTGRLTRPDQLIGAIAGAGHFLLIAGCVAGFIRTRPARRARLAFGAGGVVAIGYFLVIVATTGRQYLPLMHRVFHV